MTYIIDPHSFSNPNEVVVNHLDLKLMVDFETKTLTGVAKWQFLKSKEEVQNIIFDTHHLFVTEVQDDQGKPLEFKVIINQSEESTFMGSQLNIDIQGIKSNVVQIFYKTSPNSKALQWLGSAQTEGKRFPFMFTQSQAILARSWVPCQDSPQIRFTYNAEVTVPKGMMALMSAINPQQKNEDGHYSFKMDKKIPAYLLALAVGDVEFKAIDYRTGIYAESEMLDKAVWEFADAGKMVTAAESLYGPYQWNRYDLIILPPSFPFGGMENPELTFCTPTVIAGDRSETSLVAHELAHSWSGNLVTNATWNDFWLNEGFTVYFERRIMEFLYGKDYAEMLTVIGNSALRSTYQLLSETPELTSLKLKLEGKDADDGMNPIAYEKGFNLLLWIENQVGRIAWDEFIKTYFNRFAFQSMDTESFLVYLYEALPQLNTPEQSTVIHNWIYGQGQVAEMIPIHSTKFELVESQVTAYLNNQLSVLDISAKEWCSHEYVHFLTLCQGKLNISQITDLDGRFHFTTSGNCEISSIWYLICIEVGYDMANPQIKSFCIKVGRRKFIVPIYRALAKTDKGLSFAKEIYAEARAGYHTVATHTIDQLLNN